MEDRQAELTITLQNSTGRLAVSQSADPVDQMCELTDRELDSQSISLLISARRQVLKALAAIRDGSYGRCASCDGDIPLKRLQAIPWSSCCVPCQEEAEARAVWIHADTAHDSLQRGT